MKAAINLLETELLRLERVLEKFAKLKDKAGYKEIEAITTELRQAVNLLNIGKANLSEFSLDAENSFSFAIQKDNPKNDAPQYKLKTVQEIFDILTEKNIDKFMLEFKMIMQVGINVRNISKAVIEKEEGVVPEDDCLKMPSFVWIDD